MPGISWKLVLGAAFLGGLVAVVGYGYGEGFGAGIALALVISPLLLTSAQKAPQFFLVTIVALLAINCFGFLTDSAIFFRLMSTCAIVALAMRFAMFDVEELRPFVLLCFIQIIATVIVFLNFPSMEAGVLSIMWLTPFLGIYTGAGLWKRYPTQAIDAWYILAVASGIGIAMVNIWQWAAAGFLVQSYTISGPFLNANFTGAMLGFICPIYLSMTQDQRGAYRVAGWGSFALALLALMILVSRTALGLALAAPALFFLRGRPVLILGFLAFIIWFGWLQTGMVSVESWNLPAPLEKIVATYRLEPKEEGETARYLSYGISGLAIMAKPVEGYGFGSGRTIMMNSGHEAWGPENLWMRNWLEGGLYLLIPTLIYYLWCLWRYYIPGIWHSGRLHHFTYALVLSCMMSFIYYLFNGAQTHMSIRNMEGMALGTLALLLTPASAKKELENEAEVA